MSPRYEAACQAGWNAVTADQRPIGFVYCANTNDVVHTINFARKNHPHVVVRYNDADNRALCDGALVIDLSQMKSCRVWPCDQVALVEPGLTWAEVNEKTVAEHGLAVPAPEGSAGVASSTLGGGGGLLSRQYGLACDNLLEVEVVTTDGSVVRAKATENPDLFWAVRGAGSMVGIVTSFLFALKPVQSAGVYAGTLMFPVEWAKEFKHAKNVYETWMEVRDSLPPNASISAMLTTPPPDKRPSLSTRPIHKPAWGSAITSQENVYTHAYGHPCLVLTVLYNGPVDEICTTIFQPLINLGPAVNTLGMMSYNEAANLTSWVKPAGDRYYSEGAILRELSWDVLLSAMEAVRKSPRVSVMFQDFTGGAVESVDGNAMAFPHRNALVSASMLARWTDKADDTTSITSVQALHRQLDAAGQTTGGCHLSDYIDKIDEAAAYGPLHTKRLAELRAEYDPAMVLMVNHPISQ